MISVPLRIAVAGFAHGHAGAYCDVLRQHDDARLVAAWDTDPARGQEQAARFGMEYSDTLDHLLARDDVDAVIVTCETNRHADIVVAACAAGKHVLCQKPMATTLEDCDRIIEAAEKSGVHFQMAFQMRCDPMNRQIKQWVEEGAVGKVGAIRRRHCLSMLFEDWFVNGPTKWHFDPEKNVGMFFDDASHAADFLYWIMGRPRSVMAEIDNTLTSVSSDDCGIAIYRWPGDAMGVLFNSSVAWVGENTCEVYGDKGVIIQNYDDAVSTHHAPPGTRALKLYRKESGQWEYFDYELPPNHGERIKAVAHDWIDVLRNGLPPTASARDGKVSVEMCLAAYQSASEGRRVTIN